MHRFTIDFSHNKSIVCISENLFPKIPEMLLRFVSRNTSVCIITDSKIATIYLHKLRKKLKKFFPKTHSIIIPQGEKSKSLAVVEKIYNQLIEFQMDRGSLIVSLGGGVVGDVGGFVASTFLRGIKFVQIPTTLLAQVDSSIGGKVGIDLKNTKNIVGAFYQPIAIFIDPLFIRTLPSRELRNGFAEVIKYAIISSKKLFNRLASCREKLLGLNPFCIEKIITQCVRIKARIVELDERETHLRKIINFGHTIGHAIESAGRFKLFTHGETVSLGIVAESYISRELGHITHSDFLSIKNLLSSYGLPICVSNKKNITHDEVFNFIMSDKKIYNGKLSMPILKRIGNVEICDGVDYNLLKESLDVILK